MLKAQKGLNTGLNTEKLIVAKQALGFTFSVTEDSIVEGKVT